MGGAPCVQLKLGSARMRAACYRSKFRQISYVNYLARSRPLVDLLPLHDTVTCPAACDDVCRRDELGYVFVQVRRSSLALLITLLICSDDVCAFLADFGRVELSVVFCC